jgi:ABC-type spermidine/putrescine transport system permease subunit II
VVTLFLKGSGVETLPVVFWATLSKHIPTPELNAASTIILGLSILFVLVANRFQRGESLYRF